VIFDSDILIWVAREDPAAIDYVMADGSRCVSLVSYMELVQGARNRDELRATKSFLSTFGFRVLPLTENIGHRAAMYVEEYVLQVALSIPDALIAATAVENSLTLSSGNAKHFSAIDGLDFRHFVRE
jgi:predicted nucleic acid-binding protein